MRIMSVNVEYFLFDSRGLFSKLNPMGWLRKGVVNQYINIQKLKKLRRHIMPDLMMVHQIKFVGRGKVPQVTMMNNSLFIIPTPNNYPRHNPKHQLCRILSNSDIRVFGVRVIDSDFSNHLPIVFDIEL